MASEFDLIARYFAQPAPAGFLGVGDDCALLPVPKGQSLAATTDILLEGRHFFADADPVALGHKALAVNLSDLAAMGARPLGCLLGLGLPAADPDWLTAFSRGFHALAARAQCPLLGGDTTRSAQGVVISVTALGHVPASSALRRDAAQDGDDIWVTGELGAPDIALRMLDGRLATDTAILAATRPALETPLPPFEFAPMLAGVAHAALDISDGLVQDLGHILRASNCGAEIQYECLPVHAALTALERPVVQTAVLTGGDVYQLCFTAAPAQREALLQHARIRHVRLTRIGRICAEPGLRIYDGQGRCILPERTGFDHFLE